MSRCVLCSEFSHETNTFSVQPADGDAFRRRLCHLGDEPPVVMRGTNTEMAGFMEAGERHGWTLVHAVTTTANPSGRVTDGAWGEMTGRILDRLARAPRIDGVLLALHGAMVTESLDDAEGALLGEIRERIGFDIPVAITLDLHANLSPRSVELADIICSYKTYPHVDMRECAARAADLLAQAMDAAIRPRTVMARRALLSGADGGRTDCEPMLGLLERAAAFEREPGCLYVSINAGFPHADVPDAGSTVTVTGDGASERYREMAESLMGEIWRTRAVVNNRYLGVDEAAGIAREHRYRGKPLVIADYSDNPGAGSYGDATHMLRAMLEAGVENACFGALRDEEAARQLCAAGVGATLEVELGGKVAPAFGGGPLALAGEVVSVSDGRFVYDGPMWEGMPGSLGPTAVLRVDGVDVMVSSNLQQITDLQQFLANGIDPRAKRVICLKSMQHFRAAYQPIADRIIVCDSGGLASPDLSRLTFDRVRRPIYPLDGD